MLTLILIIIVIIETTIILLLPAIIELRTAVDAGPREIMLDAPARRINIVHKFKPKAQFLHKAAYVALLLAERDGKVICEDSRISEADLNDTITLLGGSEQVLGLLRKNYVALAHDDLRIKACHARGGKCQGCEFYGECH